MQYLTKLAAATAFIAAFAAAPATAATINYDMPGQDVLEVDCSKLDYANPTNNFKFEKSVDSLWTTNPTAARGIMAKCDAAEHPQRNPQVLAANTQAAPAALPKVGASDLTALTLAAAAAALFFKRRR
jgi:hypothetical protein